MRLSIPLVALAVVTSLTACAEKVDETKPPQLDITELKRFCTAREPIATTNVKFRVSIRGKDKRTLSYTIHKVLDGQLIIQPGLTVLTNGTVADEEIALTSAGSITVVSEHGQQVAVGTFDPVKICSK